MGLASILLREGHLDDTVIVTKKALEVREVCFGLLLSDFILHLNKYASLELVFLSYSLTCIFMLYYFFVFYQVSPSLALGHFILGNVFGAQVS